jgi:hypothetical protein
LKSLDAKDTEDAGENQRNPEPRPCSVFSVLSVLFVAELKILEEP